MSVEVAQATPETQKPTVPQVEGTEGLPVARTDLTLTDAGLSAFTRLVTRYARSQAYFLDETPERVYHTTERLAAVVSDGEDVWVMAPQLQVRSAKTHQYANVNQILTRDLALEGMRLKAIKALVDQGALPYLRAVGLCGGKDPDDAIDEHAARWEQFLSGIQRAGKPEKLKRSARPSPARPSSRLPVGELTIGVTALTAVVRQHQETRPKKILYAATTGGTILSLLAAACSPTEASPTAPVTPSPALSPTAGENPTPTNPPTPDTQPSSVPGTPVSEVGGAPKGESYPVSVTENDLSNHSKSFATPGEAKTWLLDHIPVTADTRSKLEEDIDAIIALLTAELGRSNKSADNYNWVPSPAPKSWNLMLQDKTTGQFLIPANATKNADGTESYLIMSSLSLFDVDFKSPNEDFFGLLALKNPATYPDAKQELLAHTNGWHIIGAFVDGKLVAWYDAGSSPDRWMDIATGKPIEGPPPTAVPPTAVTPETISQAEMEELAAQLNCRASTCVHESMLGGRKQGGVEALSSGHIETIEIRNTQTGELIAYADALVAVTKDPSGKTKPLYIVIQLFSPDQRNINLTARITNYILGNYQDIDNPTPHSKEELEVAMSRGKYFGFGFPLDITKISQGHPWTEVEMKAYSDPIYAEALKQFLTSKGEVAPDKPLVVFLSSVVNQ